MDIFDIVDEVAEDASHQDIFDIVMGAEQRLKR